MVLSGIGIGIANPAIARVGLGVVPPERSGMASGLSNTFRIGGLATGVAALGAVFQQRITSSMSSKCRRARRRDRSCHLLGRRQGGRPRRSEDCRRRSRRIRLGVAHDLRHRRHHRRAGCRRRRVARQVQGLSCAYGPFTSTCVIATGGTRARLIGASPAPSNQSLIGVHPAVSGDVIPQT